MFVIRREQMDALSKYMLEEFVNRMVVHLRTACPAETEGLSDPELRALIRTGIDRSAQYKVTDETDVRRYLEYVALYGVDFDSNPRTAWAGQILRDTTLTGEQKMDQIDDHYTFIITADQRTSP